MSGLTPDQKRQYDQDGFTVLHGLLSAQECDGLIEHMMDLQRGRKTLEGFKPRQPEDWSRTHNQHFYDPVAMDVLVDPRLRQPLEDCFEDEVDGIQTMYFYKGSEQRRHQDQYYLPGCMSAWIALQDVSPVNGTIFVQPGSQKGRLVTRESLRQPGQELPPLFGAHYDDAVDALYAQHGVCEVPVVVSKGDVVLFDGVLIHRGGPITDPASFRNVMANHYIPRHFTGWPFENWPRIPMK